MKEGEKTCINSSFLAHGIAGDLDRVPPQSPLRYDIRLIQVVRWSVVRLPDDFLIHPLQ